MGSADPMKNGADAPAVPNPAAESLPNKSSSGFVGSVLRLSGGAFIAQALGFFCAPVTARLFAPDAYGASVLFGSVVVILTVASCLRYELAILLPKEDKEAANLFAVCCILVAGFTILVAIALATSGSTFLGWLGASDLDPYKWWLPVNVFLTGIAFPLNYWNSRQRHFGRLATRQILSTAVGLAGMISGGALGFQTGGYLILMAVLTAAVNALTLAIPLVRHDLEFIRRKVTLADMCQTARRYVRFPLVDLWSAMLNVTSLNMPSLLLTAYVGLSVVGLYARASQLVLMPMRLIGSAIGQVFFQRSAAKHADGEEIGTLTEEVLSRLIAFSLLPVLVTAMIGPEIIIVVCGDRWAEAGVYAQILTPWLFVLAITSPITGLINTLERLGVGLAFNVVLVVARIATLVFAGWYFQSARWMIFLYMIVGTAANLWMLTYLLRAVRARFGRLLTFLVRHVAYAIPTLAVAAAVKFWFHLTPWPTLIAVAIATIPYWILAGWHDAVARGFATRALARVRATLREQP